MIKEFFTEVNVPEFLTSAFAKDDWYLVLRELKDILNENIQESKIESSNSTLKTYGNVHIGKGCTIGDYVVIEGPVYIGDNVEIGPGVYIRAGSVIGNGCSVAHAAEVKNMIMMDGAKIANHTFLGDSILGSRARMGGHSETANRKFDQSEVQFIYKDKKLDTGMNKLGLILGEDSRLGGGVFTFPGTMIGKNTFVSTALSVGGFIPSDSFVKSKQEIEILDNRFTGNLKHTMLFDKDY